MSSTSYQLGILSISGSQLTVTGDSIISNNLTVQGTASINVIQFVSQSSLNIGTNLITVNTATPTSRFGGLAVYDSGSTGTGLTGSMLWDSQNNTWIYTNPSGGLYDGAMILMGPRSTGMGDEVGINTGYAAVGDGSHHITSSQIYSSASLIRLEANTQVTGSLKILDSATSFQIVGNGFGQTYLQSLNGALVLNPGYGGVQINGTNPDLTVNGNISVGGYITSTTAGSYLTGSLQGTSSLATTASYALTGIPSTNTGEKLYTYYNFY